MFLMVNLKGKAPKTPSSKPNKRKLVKASVEGKLKKTNSCLLPYLSLKQSRYF